VAAALAGTLAFAFGRRIAGAVGSLVRIARAVERGQRAQPLNTGVTEVNTLAEQLRAAADRARKREEEAAAREHQARAISAVAHALNASPDLDAVLRAAVAAVHNLVQADSARIALVEEAGLVLRYSTQASTAAPPGFVIERGHGIGGRVLATGRPVRTDDVTADPRFRADRYISIARTDGIISCMAVPIVTADGVVVRSTPTTSPCVRSRRSTRERCDAGRPCGGGRAEGATAGRRALRPVGGGSVQPGQG
jgi:hypothetical protein